jgi:hypothetical protein
VRECKTSIHLDCVRVSLLYIFLVKFRSPFIGLYPLGKNLRVVEIGNLILSADFALRSVITSLLLDSCDNFDTDETDDREFREELLFDSLLNSVIARNVTFCRAFAAGLSKSGVTIPNGPFFFAYRISCADILRLDTDDIYI